MTKTPPRGQRAEIQRLLEPAVLAGQEVRDVQ